MTDDSVPEIEIDGEVTEATESPDHTTRPHATVEWLEGFNEGRRRGAADILDALAAALAAVGVGDDVAAVIVSKVQARAGLLGG
ncbi:MAG: hypothetical protein JWM82_1825 [Myxococcales bacterium]|nr:hypothetical protein [Myxococcales bacterium]